MVDSIKDSRGYLWKPDSWPIAINERLPKYAQTKFDQIGVSISPYRPTGTIGSADQDLNIIFHEKGVDFIGFYTGPAANRYGSFLRQLAIRWPALEWHNRFSLQLNYDSYFFYATVQLSKKNPIKKELLPFLFREQLPELEALGPRNNFRTGPKTKVVVHLSLIHI